MIEWHFFEKVYRVWLVVVVCSPEEFKDFMQKTGYKYVEDLRCDSAKGMCIDVRPEDNDVNNNAYVMWFREWETSTLVHEISHLCMMIFDNQGVPLSRENTEAFAFYTEYWFNEISRTRKRLPQGRTPAQARKSRV
jgi:hypothetical protein